MENKKYLQVLECLTEAQDIFGCPLCYESDRTMIQCSVGHHICMQCKAKLTQCPLCKSPFSEIKCYLVQEMATKLAKLKILLNNLDEDINMQVNVVNKYTTCRKLVEIVTSKLSTFLYKSHDILQYLSKYLLNPNSSDRKELERQLVSLTSELQRVKYLMDETKHTLTTLKK